MAQPVIPWQGGKRRLAKHILPRLPQHTCYVEPFAGGAAILFMRDKPAKAEVLNDINGELVNLYRVIRYHPDELLRQFDWQLVSRESFGWAKQIDPSTLTDVQRAARFFYLQKTSFGAKADGHTFGTSTTTSPKLNSLRLPEILAQAHERLARVCIEHLTWQDCIKRYDRAHTLFYCDPPYWETAGYGMSFDWQEYVELEQLMKTVKGKVILSINDHPDIRKLFASYPMESLSTRYTAGGGQGKSAEELLIFNFTPEN